MDELRAAVCQFEHLAGDKATNFKKIEAFVGQAMEAGVKLLAFPECCITGYWFLRKRTRSELVELAEEVPSGPSTQRLLKLASNTKMTIGAGLLEREGEKLSNTYVVAMPDGRWAKHRKIQAFEHEAISPGNQYTVFQIDGGVKVGILICYDNNILENVRITALMGAQVLLAPHQTGGCNSVSPFGLKPIDQNLWRNRKSDPDAIQRELLGPKGKAWLMRWLPSRAHDNGLFILFANGIGIDDDEVRTGNSMILDPYGRTMAETNEPGDAMVIADLDLSLINMSTGRRWLKSRRPEMYGRLVEKTGIERDTREVRFGKDLNS